MDLQSEKEFFHHIADQVLQLVVTQEGSAEIAKHKSIVGDLATKMDMDVERLIVDEIGKCFQGDSIMAEESYADTPISDGRMWIIDPICGTTNLSRGINWFCTNIALVDNRQLIASCVIDHSQGVYYWSIGNNELYLGDQLLPRMDIAERKKIVIDVDFGAIYRMSDDDKRKHCDAVCGLSMRPGYMIVSPSSSLGFTYTAARKIDGFINAINYPWDIAAGSFLLQQAGGIITDLDGQPWNLTSIGAIGATDAIVHQTLVESYSMAL